MAMKNNENNNEIISKMKAKMAKIIMNKWRNMKRKRKQ
jgi:hypothetical protein